MILRKGALKSTIAAVVDVSPMIARVRLLAQMSPQRTPGDKTESMAGRAVTYGAVCSMKDILPTRGLKLPSRTMGAVRRDFRSAILALSVLALTLGSIATTSIAARAESDSAAIAHARASAGPLPHEWHATSPLHYIERALSPHVHGSSTTADASPPYSPAQMRSAYGLSNLTLPNTTGAGETVAIVDAYGDWTSKGVDDIQTDLQSFCTLYGLPYTASGSGATVTEAFPDGTPKANTSWADEVCLDVEWVHAMAPGAKILLVLATNTGNSLYDCIAYANSHANIVSMSWGGSEFSGEQSYDSAYFSTPGVSYFVASGDDGAGSSYPAASPDVTAVGGTTLTVDSDGNWVSETGWSGSGGGPSTEESMPSYQSEWVAGGTREIPDVAMEADPSTGVQIYCQGSLSGLWGGTSLPTPMWAGVMAVVDANLSSPMGEAALHSALYQYGSPSNIDSYYRDIVSGSNGAYSCEVGYDEVTGIGTPIGYALLPAIAPGATSTTPAISGFTPTSGPAGTSVTISGSNLTGATGVSFGGVAAATFSVVSSSEVTATVPSGAATGAIVVTTPSGAATSVSSFTVTTAQAPVLSAFTLSAASGLGGRSVTGTVTLTAAAPSGGAVVTLASANTSVIALPASVTVKAGAKTASFSFTPSAVSANTAVSLSASYGGVGLSQTYTVDAPALSEIVVSPATVTGGSGNATLEAVLTGIAPTGGASVTVSSSSSALTVTSPMTIAAGSTTGTTTLTSHTVTSSTSVTITVSYGGKSASVKVTVNPVKATTKK